MAGGSASPIDQARLSATAGWLLGAVVALAALGVLHHGVQPVRAAICGLLGVGTAALLARTWSDLPAFVSRWLAAGVVVVVALVAAASTAASSGPAYLLLRGRDLATIGAAAGGLGLGLAALAYTHRRLAAEVADSAVRMSELERRALQERLSALSAQINPHFLFNTLNVLAQVVHEDEDVAEEVVTDLAAMMRYVLKGSATRVPLSEELEIVRRMLHLEEVRLGDRLAWSVSCADGLDDVRVPVLLVQPLVENAVRHAVVVRHAGGRVDVRVDRHGDRVRIYVSDDGPGLPDAVAGDLLAEGRGTSGAGGGLRNVAERVRLAWPGDRGARLVVVPADQGAHVCLEIPMEEA